VSSFGDLAERCRSFTLRLRCTMRLLTVETLLLGEIVSICDGFAAAFTAKLGCILQKNINAFLDGLPLSHCGPADSVVMRC